MKFSIVTISYNQAQFLKEAVESVLAQRDDGVDLEYIVVDPGSTDGSRDIIREYGDDIDLVVFEPDHGPADGLSKGFRLASGDFGGYINSDDLLLPHSLKRVETFLALHPEVDVVVGDGIRRDERRNPIRERRHVSSRFSAVRYAYQSATFLQQSTFFRMDAFRAVGGFNSGNRTCWDGELLSDLSRTGFRFRNLHQDLSVFRVHQGSISGSGRLEAAYEDDLRRIGCATLGRRPVATLGASLRLLSKLERVAAKLARP